MSLAQPDLFAAKPAPAAESLGPLWAMECRACGHRARYLDHSCPACGSCRTVGRDRGSFDAHKRALRRVEGQRDA